jgi:hypothetical protein
MSSSPIVNRIRIIPRDNEFLNINVGSSGELYYSIDTATIRAYDGRKKGGHEVVTESTIAKSAGLAEIAAIRHIVTVEYDIDENLIFNVDGEKRAVLRLLKGFTYIFDQNDPSNEYFPNLEGQEPNIHPLIISADDANGHLGTGSMFEEVIYVIDNDQVSGPDEYARKFSAASYRHVQVIVKNTFPAELYYYSYNTLNMGNYLNVDDINDAFEREANGDIIPLLSTNNLGRVDNTWNELYTNNITTTNLSTTDITATNISADNLTSNNITATNLSADSITIEDIIAQSILPDTTNTYDIGSTEKVWNNLFSNNITVYGNIIPSGTNNTIGNSNDVWNTVYASIFNGTALTAKYADLAENYKADEYYEAGTVVIFGGAQEVTTTNIKNDTRVAGVVSANPAYLMNADCKGDNIIPIALQGRVFVKVVGIVKKGDLLVTAAQNGYSIVNNNPPVGSVIGKSLDDKITSSAGLVEIVVGRD